MHPYEALSYVWGGSDKPQSIFIREHNSKSGHNSTSGHDLPVTENLHAALTRLRYSFYERIIWIDAVCIDQNDEREKEQQIQFMAKIYALANRVVVWLGEAAEDSDQALYWIRVAGSRKPKNSSNDETIRQAVIALLQRPWFRRIWVWENRYLSNVPITNRLIKVLQEVAAARHILIMCGPTEIDGYAFCLGVDSFKGFDNAHVDLQSLVRSVTYLIRGAIFRPEFAMSRSDRASLDICSLGELVDMYHAHEATKRHDKVFALLGMSSDDLSTVKLLPDYRVPWEELLQRLAKYLLCEEISVETWGGDREIAVIESKGSVLGKVELVHRASVQDDREGLDVILKNREGSTRLTLQASAKSVRDGDLVCLLQGASNPTIIRWYQDYFGIVMIAARPPEKIPVKHGYVEWAKFLQPGIPLTRNFILVWDWETSSRELHYPQRYDRVMEYSTELEGYLDKATRIWDVALILGDSGECQEAEEKLQEAIKGYEIAFGMQHPYTLESRYGLTPLSWAAENGYDAVVHLLLTKNGVNPDLKDSQFGRTPLSWAAENGHDAVVHLLLAKNGVDPDLKDSQFGRTPLSWAAGGGREAIVKLLLETGKAEIDSKDNSGQTPFWWAVKGWHEPIVKLLLKASKVGFGFDSKDNDGQTLLSWAARGGHEAIVKLLLKTGKVELDSKDKNGQTPLSLAAWEGHKAIVKLLLKTGKVELDSKDENGQTPLSLAAWEGHEAIVKLLLKTGKVKINPKNSSGYTPLFYAVDEQHETIVKLLLETGKAEVDFKTDSGQTLLSLAAKLGNETIVKLLLDTGKVDVNSEDNYGDTPLSLAVNTRNKAVIKLLESSIR
jgi:ankyrin repeat protein